MKIFDAHFHIIDMAYPVVENNGYMPEQYLSRDYQKNTESLPIAGGAIVSGSFQTFDQGYLVAALQSLGKGFVGVTQLPHTASDEEIIRLNKSGVRAVRFNLFRGGSESLENLASFASRVYELVGWHVELYVDSNQLADMMPTLAVLPKISIDHLGLKKDGFDQVLALVDKGHKVKATGFMRVDFDVLDAMKKVISVNPQALMFGTDLPGTRASRQFSISDLALIKNNFSEHETANILYHNAVAFYRLNDDQQAEGS